MRIGQATTGKLRNRITSNRVFAISLRIQIEFFVLNLVLFEKFGCWGYSTNCKLTIVKHVLTNWLGNGEKMTSQSNWKLRFPKSSWDVFTGS